MKKIDISSEIDNIKSQLVKKYRPEKIILFGSAVWGESDEVYDLDFFIIKKEVPYYGGDRIGELYRFMDAHMAVDYLVYTPDEVQERLALGDPFIKKIINEGKLLYG
jgi:predicted nucleotidyltransferase